MLTGKRAFEGEDISDTLAAVLRAEPNWDALHPDIAPNVHTLIQRCLEKDRAQRIADISIVKFLLTEPSLSSGTARQPRSRVTTAVLTAAIVLLSLTAAAFVWHWRPAPPPAQVIRFPIDLPEGQAFNSTFMWNVAVSHDGTQIVYAANSRLYHRLLSQMEARPLPGTESTGEAVASPIFSPDDHSLAFLSAGAIKTIPVDGGSPVVIATLSRTPLGMSWTTGGIVFADDNGIYKVTAGGGQPERLITRKADELFYGPQILPSGESVLLTVGSFQNFNRWDQAKIVVQSLKTGQRKTLIEGGSDARYLPSGYLLYSVSGTIWAAPFDLRQETVSSRGAPVIQGVRRNTAASGSAVTQMAVSDTGTVLYIPGPADISNIGRSLVLTDRNGVQKPLPLPSGPYRHPRVSGDGKHAAVGIDDGREAYISIYDLSMTSPLRRLTFGGHNRFGIWSGDSQFIAFQSDREGDSAIFMQRADGSTPPERLTKPEPGVSHIPESWSRDGRTLLFSASKDNKYSLWILSLPGKQVMRFGTVESVETIGATFSPDDHWVAYTWTDAQAPNRGSPNRGVYIQPFPPTGVLYQVPRDYRDFHPAWGATTAELFYIPTRLSVISVQTKPTLTFGKALNLPTPATRDRVSPEVRDYDVTPDGQSFLSTVPAGEEGSASTNVAPQIRVVVNWFRELQERVPVK
jgi:serine/threonine-protein kinase